MTAQNSVCYVQHKYTASFLVVCIAYIVTSTVNSDEKNKLMNRPNNLVLQQSYKNCVQQSKKWKKDVMKQQMNV